MTRHYNSSEHSNFFIVQALATGSMTIFNKWNTNIVIDNDVIITPANSDSISVNYNQLIKIEEEVGNETFRSWNENDVPFIQGVLCKITSMPSMDKFTVDDAGLIAGDNFFYSFNGRSVYAGIESTATINSFPQGSFNTSNITTAGNNFLTGLCGFNSVFSILPEGSLRFDNLTSVGDDCFNYIPSYALNTLPEGSFNIGSLETVGSNFCYRFNSYYGYINYLPEGSFDTSNIKVAGPGYFKEFNIRFGLYELPEGSFRFNPELETLTDAFSQFNGGYDMGRNQCGYLTSLPEGSFNTENIKTIIHSDPTSVYCLGCFNSFNCGGQLVCLPKDSFRFDSLETIVGTTNCEDRSNFGLFNGTGRLKGLPQGSFNFPSLTSGYPNLKAFNFLYCDDSHPGSQYYGDLCAGSSGVPQTGIVNVMSEDVYFFNERTRTGDFIEPGQTMYYDVGECPESYSTTLILDEITKTQLINNDFEITGRLETTFDQTPLGEQAIFFTITGPAYHYYNATTESDGSFSFIINYPDIGDYTIQGVFSGVGVYKQSVSKIRNFELVAEPYKIEIEVEVASPNPTYLTIANQWDGTINVNGTLVAQNLTTSLYASDGDIITITENDFDEGFRSWNESFDEPLFKSLDGAKAKIITLPLMKRFTTDLEGTDAGDGFFRCFNSKGNIISFPDGSLDITNITTTGSSFFEYFNFNGDLEHLPAGSMNTSTIKTFRDVSPFRGFNQQGHLESLPFNSFNQANLKSVNVTGYFENFNYGGNLTPGTLNIYNKSTTPIYGYYAPLSNDPILINPGERLMYNSD